MTGGKIENPTKSGKAVIDEKMKKCLIRTCNRIVTGNVSKKWLMRLKKRLMKKVGTTLFGGLTFFLHLVSF